MRIMAIIKATKNSEAGLMPDTALLTAMGAYNEELMAAGVMVGGEGLLPSTHGKRIVMSGGQKQVVDGPFAETKELIAGFWIWEVRSMDEALAWARRCPDPMPGEEAVIELRRIASAEDFGEAFTPEMAAAEDRMREELEARQKD